MKSLFLVAATLLLALNSQAQDFGGDRGGFDRDGRGGWDRGGRDDFGGGWDRGGRDDFGGGRGGWDRDGRDGRGPGRPGPGWPGRDREETKVVRCESHDKKPATCGAGGRVIDARVSRQLSNAACLPGQTWGYDRDYIWVQSGCRAEFVVTVREEGRPGRPGPGPRPPRVDSIRCASQGYRFASCSATGFIDFIEIERQHSRSACVQGQTFGYNNQSIWVDKGCEATFRVYYR